MAEQANFTERKLKTLAITTMILSIFLTSLLAFWTLYPYKPMLVEPAPFKIVYPESRIVKQGGYIAYEFNYEKKSDVIPTLNRQFVDGLVFNVEGTANPTVTVPGKGTARAQVEIPETLPPGQYQLRITATYQMNPIRKLCFTYITEDFEVISGRNTDAEQDTVIKNTENR